MNPAANPNICSTLVLSATSDAKSANGLPWRVDAFWTAGSRSETTLADARLRVFLTRLTIAIRIFTEAEQSARFLSDSTWRRGG